MQYQVLARKWRPQNFHELVGQEHVARSLINALQTGRVAHAFLFAGPRGSGKTTTARILAKALNCHENKPAAPCTQCVACVEIAGGNCMDVLEIDAASNRGIDEIRELRDNVRYSPARDKYKVFIIDEVHMLTAEAFNALLKTLEEPPSHVVFILATTEYHKIPATILSRCQQYNFKLIAFPLILERLRQIANAEEIQISHSCLEQIAFSSGGSMRDAMSALDQVLAFSGNTVRAEDVTLLLGLVEPALLANTVRAIAQRDVDRLLKVVDELVVTGQDLQNFCRRLLGQFRNLMVLKAGASDPSILGIPESLLPDLQKQAALFSQEDLLRLFDSLLQTEVDLKYATQIRFELEMGLIKLAQIARLRSLEDLITEFTALVKGAPGTARLDNLARSEEKVEATAPQPPSAAEVSREVPAEGREPRTLMERIAAAVHKQPLQSILEEVESAKLEGNVLILDLASLNDFYLQQIRENLSVIAQAASAVVGQSLKVVIGNDKASVTSGGGQLTPTRPESEAPMDTLDKAKREPVVRSFLDTFPGPVKAEEID